MNTLSAQSVEVVPEVVRTLRGGRIAIVPTQRWYMICCDAERRDLVEQIHHAKRRPLDKPLLMLMPDPAYLRKCFQTSAPASRLIDRLLPGELSLLMAWRSTEMRDRYLSAPPEGTLVSCAPGLLGAVTSAFGAPLACTSANVSGEPSPEAGGPAISIAQVRAFVDGSGLRAALVVNGGICPNFQPTTVVDAMDMKAEPVIIRQGFVHDTAIEMALMAGGCDE
ncbi:MAG: Sua5/YciO/YrdC/YwlC family protein [Candidatus Eisenbacteria bacterium]|nr:Sua5/YciO/YrdC/YwlC family protein [Candidatus Eisenbacteria bacterium]